MFYLIHSLKLTRFHPFRFLGFFFLSAILILSASNSSLYKRIIISNKISKQDTWSYFNILIEKGENQNRIARKLKQLVGVKKVEKISSKQLNKTLNHSLKDLNLKNIESSDLEIMGLKVYLGPFLDHRSIDLIKDYIRRLVGEKNVTIGSIQKPSELLKKNTAYLKGIGHYYQGAFLLGVGFLWLIFLVLISSVIKKEAFLLSRYHRSRFIESKLKLGPILFSLLLGWGPSFIGAYPSFSKLIIVSLIMILLSMVCRRGSSWEA